MKTECLRLLVWNARSLNNKCDDTMCLLQDYKVDIAIICETWLTDQANSTTANIKSYGYGLVHSFRSGNRGGGTSLVYNSSLQFNTVNLYLNETSTFEYTTGTLKCTADMKVLFICIYRTGPTSSKFFDEFDNILGAASLKNDYIIVAGDFNVDFAMSPTREPRIGLLSGWAYHFQLRPLPVCLGEVHVLSR